MALLSNLNQNALAMSYHQWAKKKTLPIYTIEGSLPNSSHEAYKKLTRTACNMALIPLMLNSHFTVPLEYQSEDAVFLIDGRDNNKAFCHICEQL